MGHPDDINFPLLEIDTFSFGNAGHFNYINSNFKLPIMGCLFNNTFCLFSKLFSGAYYRFEGSKESVDAQSSESYSAI